MNESDKYHFENVLPNGKRLDSTKIRFNDGNDIIDTAKKESAIKYAKNINLLFFILIFVFYSHIIASLFKVSILNYEDDLAKETNNFEKRGKILDRNGEIIATTIKTKDFYLNTRKILNPKKLKENLKKIFKEKDDEFFERVFSKKQYIRIKSYLTQYEIYELKKIGDPGINFQNSSKRVYPQHSLFSHLTGFLSSNLKSKLEKNLNSKLQNGDDVTLSVDLRVQTIVHEELSKSLRTFDANSALSIVMDVNNGEIISMVSLPDFNPNYPEKIQAFSENNLATEARYEMGSTLKIFNAAMAYENNSKSINEIYNISDGYQISSKKVIDDKDIAQKQLNFEEVFIKSSNVGSIKVLESTGIDKQRDFFETIGITKNIDLKGIKIVSNKLPENWNEQTSKSISYGYGISLSPISLITSFSSLVNGGYEINPQIYIKNQAERKRIIKKETSYKINNLIEKIVENGTGKRAKILGLRVGGKTGTSNKVENGNYSENKVITSFIGIFPMEEPKYLTLVLFDEPKKNNEESLGNFASNTAAPTFAKIVKKISPILNKKNYLYGKLNAVK